MTPKIRFAERWRRARQDTRGFRAWKRELSISMLAGALAYLALSKYGSPQSAREQAIVAGVTMFVTALLVPLIELAWNFLKAPYRIAQDQIQGLRQQVETLQRKLEASSGFKSLTRARLQEFYNRGGEIRQSILDEVDEGEASNKKWWSEFAKWREELLDYVHSISPSKAAFIDEVKVVGTPISYRGQPLRGWKADTVKHFDSRLERLRIVMQDYPTGSQTDFPMPSTREVGAN